MFCKNVTTLLIFCSNSGRNLHRVIGVSFGLLCVLQAALNICLRLIIYSEAPNGTAEERNTFDKLDPYFKRGWFHFQKSLYYISSVKNTWHLSREYCLQEGADLAIINSRAEQAFLENFKMTLWIGLMEQRSERTWRWVDGTPLTESYWSLGEPNNYEGRQEQCVEQVDREDKKGWNDLVCEFSNFYMCEKRIFP
uniref:C-type lectin domain-containing protein n=1 Tax=Takifugu rubripes TaxID=31033 RepID=A0A3B5KEF3_TAKRU